MFRIRRNWLLLALAPALAAPAPSRAQPYEWVSVDDGPPAPTLRLLHVNPSPQDGRERGTVLFVHGATFPSAVAAGYRIAGSSWMDALASAGYDVWALDFAGYGASARYPGMASDEGSGPPLGRAHEAAAQIQRASAEIRSRRPGARLSIVAHSWGTIPAALFTWLYPERVCRLVLFGAVVPRGTAAPDSSGWRAHHDVSEQAQRQSFWSEVPPGHGGFFAGDFAAWSDAYLATDPHSRSRTPAAVRVPFGPIADIQAARGGWLPYDPGAIAVPVLLVRGEHDRTTTAADQEWLFRRLARSPGRRNVTLPGGTHRMHLEVGRARLFEEVAGFLRTPVPGTACE